MMQNKLGDRTSGQVVRGLAALRRGDADMRTYHRTCFVLASVSYTLPQELFKS